MGWSEVKEEKAAVQAGFGGHERNPIPNGLASSHGTGRMSSTDRATAAACANAPGTNGGLGCSQAACEPRCAQPVVRFSIQENTSYIAIAIAPMVTRPANASGMRCWLPALCMR